MNSGSPIPGIHGLAVDYQLSEIEVPPRLRGTRKPCIDHMRDLFNLSIRPPVDPYGGVLFPNNFSPLDSNGLQM